MNYYDFYIGIDPSKIGGQGGIATTDGDEVAHYPMPATERDAWELIRSFGRRGGNAAFAYIEWINPGIRAIGKSHMSKLYGGYTALRMALIAAKIPFEDVKPLTWQRGLGIQSRAKSETDLQWKERLKGVAQQIFPHLPIWSEPRSKGRQLAIADALLIAEFARRVSTGELK